MGDARRERGELRVPVLPAALRPPPGADPPPQLPVLSGPVSRRRRRRARIGLGLWLGIAAAGVAAGIVALILAQPSGDRSAAVTTAPPPGTTAPPPTTVAPAPPPAPPPPFRLVAASEPQALLAAVTRSAAVLLTATDAWSVGGESGGTPTSTVARIAGGVASNVGTFEEPLAEAAFAPDGDALLLAGGYTGTQWATAVLRFLPPGGTSLVARLPQALRGATAAVLGRTLYVAGGRTESGPSRALVAVDLTTGTVHTLARLPEGGTGLVLVAAGPKLFLAGKTRLWRLAPATGKATAAGPAPAALRGGVALGGGLVAGGGRVWRVRP